MRGAVWLLVAALCPWPATAAPAAEAVGAEAVGAEVVGVRLLPTDKPGFGGFSGLEFSPDGVNFIALSDRAALVGGHVTRDGTGAVTAISLDQPARPLRDRLGQPLSDPMADSEGLRLAADGTLLISFEQMHRVARYLPDGSLIQTLPVPLAFAGLVGNRSLETLAVDRDGAIYTVPEGQGPDFAGNPLFRFAHGGWQQVATLASQGGFRPVDAQFGPDGRFYLLERDFWPLLGFRTRLRRITLGAGGVVADQVLLTTRAGRFGNLEGLSLWQDARGQPFATLVSDNNFLAVQDSEFVDLRLND